MFIVGDFSKSLLRYLALSVTVKTFLPPGKVRYQPICKPRFENLSIHVAIIIGIWFWKLFTTHWKSIWYKPFTTFCMAYDNPFSFRQWCWKGTFCSISWQSFLRYYDNQNMFRLSRQLHNFMLGVLQFFANLLISKQLFWASL